MVITEAKKLTYEQKIAHIKRLYGIIALKRTQEYVGYFNNSWHVIPNYNLQKGNEAVTLITPLDPDDNKDINERLAQIAQNSKEPIVIEITALCPNEIIDLAEIQKIKFIKNLYICKKEDFKNNLDKFKQEIAFEQFIYDRYSLLNCSNMLQNPIDQAKSASQLEIENLDYLFLLNEEQFWQKYGFKKLDVWKYLSLGT